MLAPRDWSDRRGLTFMPQGRSGPVFPFPRLAVGRRQPSASLPTIPQVVPDGKINEFWASITSARTESLWRLTKPLLWPHMPFTRRAADRRVVHSRTPFAPIGVGFPQSIHTNLGTTRDKGCASRGGKTTLIFLSELGIKAR